jgi:uncharacterized membrane protein YfcA
MHGLDFLSSSWLLAIGALTFAAFIRGATGFGLSMIFTPFIILIMNPKAAIPVNLILAQLSNVVVLATCFREVNVRRLWPMFAGSLLGVPVGVCIIVVISAATLKIMIGAVTILFSILLVLKLTPRFTHERFAAGVAGFLCGMLTTSVGLGAPPVMLFMHSQKWPRGEIYPGLSAFFLISTGASIVGLFLSGLVTGRVLLTSISLAPGLVLGVMLGMLAFKHVNEYYFRMLSVTVVIAAGILAVLSGMGVFN